MISQSIRETIENGLKQFEIGDMKKAMDLFENAKSQLELEMKNPNEFNFEYVSIVINKLCIIYCDYLADFEKAMKMNDEIIKSLENQTQNNNNNNSNSSDIYISSLVNKALILEKLGKSEESHIIFKQTKQLFEQLNHPFDSTNTKSELYAEILLGFASNLPMSFHCGKRKELHLEAFKYYAFVFGKHSRRYASILNNLRCVGQTLEIVMLSKLLSEVREIQEKMVAVPELDLAWTYLYILDVEMNAEKKKEMIKLSLALQEKHPQYQSTLLFAETLLRQSTISGTIRVEAHKLLKRAIEISRPLVGVHSHFTYSMTRYAWLMSDGRVALFEFKSVFPEVFKEIEERQRKRKTKLNEISPEDLEIATFLESSNPLWKLEPDANNIYDYKDQYEDVQNSNHALNAYRQHALFVFLTKGKHHEHLRRTLAECSYFLSIRDFHDASETVAEFVKKLHLMLFGPIHISFLESTLDGKPPSDEELKDMKQLFAKTYGKQHEFYAKLVLLLAPSEQDLAVAISKYREAIEILHSCGLDEGIQVGDACIALGEHLKKAGKLDESIVEFENSLKILPKDATYFHSKCLCEARDVKLELWCNDNSFQHAKDQRNAFFKIFTGIYDPSQCSETSNTNEKIISKLIYSHFDSLEFPLPSDIPFSEKFLKLKRVFFSFQPMTKKKIHHIWLCIVHRVIAPDVQISYSKPLHFMKLCPVTFNGCMEASRFLRLVYSSEKQRKDYSDRTRVVMMLIFRTIASNPPQKYIDRLFDFATKRETLRSGTASNFYIQKMLQTNQKILESYLQFMKDVNDENDKRFAFQSVIAMFEKKLKLTAKDHF